MARAAPITACALVLSLAGCAAASGTEPLGVAREADGPRPLVGFPTDVAPAESAPVPIDSVSFASRGHDYIAVWPTSPVEGETVIDGIRFGEDGAPASKAPVHVASFDNFPEAMITDVACAPDGDCMVVVSAENAFPGGAQAATWRADGSKVSVSLPVEPGLFSFPWLAYDSDSASFLVAWQAPGIQAVHFADGVPIESAPLENLGGGRARWRRVRARQRLPRALHRRRDVDQRGDRHLRRRRRPTGDRRPTPAASDLRQRRLLHDRTDQLQVRGRADRARRGAARRRADPGRRPPPEARAPQRRRLRRLVVRRPSDRVRRAPRQEHQRGANGVARPRRRNEPDPRDDPAGRARRGARLRVRRRDLRDRARGRHEASPRALDRGAPRHHRDAERLRSRHRARQPGGRRHAVARREGPRRLERRSDAPQPLVRRIGPRRRPSARFR